MKKYILLALLLTCVQVSSLYSEENQAEKKETEDRTDVALSYSMSGDSSGVNYVGLDILRIVNIKNNHNFLIDFGTDFGISDAKDNYLFYFAPGYRLEIGTKSENRHVYVDLITGSSLVSTPNSDKLDMGIFSSFGIGFKYHQMSIFGKAVFINSKAYSDQFIKVGFAYSF